MTDHAKREFETPKVLHDAPLRDDDAAYFHFDDFARTLARLIATKETRTPLTIGVSGPWGSGKTTLLRRVCKILDATRDLDASTQPALLDFANDDDEPQKQFRACRTVWFDAWKYAGEDQVLAALLRVIVAQMQSDRFWDKVKAALTGPKKEEVKWLGLLLNALTHFASAGSYGLKLDDFTVETPLKEASAFFDYFDDSLTRLLASWVGGKIVGSGEIDEQRGVMAVFIDDLDRCLPAKTVQVLEAIKLFLDKPGCVFVLGADTNVVCEAVTSHYKNAGVTGESANDYLEKIIQLRFELPPILGEEMGKYLSAAGDTIDEQVRSNWQTIVVGAEINPRKVKTFVNDLNLRWAMLRNSGQAQGVNRDDFTRWHVLARAAPAGFIQQAQDLPADMRGKFIADAIKWARGDASVAGSFKAYEASRRLQRILKMIEFSDQFTDKALDAFVHLTALPQPPPPEPAPKEAAAEGKAEAPEMIKGIRARELAREGEALAPGAAQRFGGIEFVRVPQGKFVMGSKDDNPLAYDDERPQHTVEIPYDYWLARYPVTNDQFATFVEATKYETTAEKEGGWSSKETKYVKGFDWRHPLGPKSGLKDKGDHPVVQVSWYDGVEYAGWLSQKLRTEIGNLEIRLPTEAEWEKAARGEYGNEWPWGNEFDPARCNSSEGGKGTTTPVGAYSRQGDSPYGAADMVGNVWEWTQSLWGKDWQKPDFKYPYDPKDGREDLKAGSDVFRVVRGGSWYGNQGSARAACRSWFVPDYRGGSRGFRLVVAPRLS